MLKMPTRLRGGSSPLHLSLLLQGDGNVGVQLEMAWAEQEGGRRRGTTVVDTILLRLFLRPLLNVPKHKCTFSADCCPLYFLRFRVIYHISSLASISWLPSAPHALKYLRILSACPMPLPFTDSQRHFLISSPDGFFGFCASPSLLGILTFSYLSFDPLSLFTVSSLILLRSANSF